LLLACLWAPPGVALNPDRLPSQYLFDRFGRDEGLPSDTVWVARSDREGFLWLGTKNGLARFDGVKFTLFNKLNQPAFRSNDIRDIEIVADGSVWLATYGGGVLHYVDGAFTAYTTDEGLADNIVHDILPAADGTLWFATSQGLSRLRGNEMRSWTQQDGLVDNRTFRLLEEPGGAIWVSTLTNGLSRFDGTAFTNFTEGSGLDSTQVHLLHQDPQLGLIAATAAGSTYRLTATGPVPHESAVLQTGMILHSALRDGDGNLWLGTYGDGLWRVGKNDTLEAFPLATQQPGYVFELSEDAEGNVWAATMHGVHRLRDSDFLQFGPAEGLAAATFVVTQSPVDGSIWTGTEGSGLFRLNPDHSVTQYTSEQGLSNDNVSSLLAEPDGTLWVGTFGGGLNHLHRDGSVTQYGRDDGLPNVHVMGLQRDANGRLWVVTDGGLVWLDPDSGRFIERTDLPATLLRELRADAQGRLWLTSNGGLLQLSNDSYQLWSEADGLGSNLVSTTYTDANGVVWIGSRESGLARLDGDQLFQFTLEHGMPQLSVLAILEDDAGCLWMSGADGLVAVERAALDAVARGESRRVRARLYDETDGLRSAQFLGGFQPAGWKTEDGRLWFPSNLGLVAVVPRDFSTLAAPAPPQIEEIRVNGEPVPIADPLMLPAEAATLEVDYTVPRLGAPHTLRFEYLLEGFDRDWHRVGGRRTAYFTGLPPGSMTLRVAASNHDAAQDTSPRGAETRLAIYRAPYWYQTWWFRILGTILALLLLHRLYRLAIRRAVVRERQLEMLVNRRTRELQIALSKVQEISRIDSLTGLANRRFLDENLDSTWAQCAAQHAPVSIIMLDIDCFKQYNDAAGHIAGDECLRKVAEALQSDVLRDEDLVARYGGEEFLALLPGADSAAVTQVAQRIRSLVRELKIPHPNSPVADYLTVSVGGATAWPAEKGTPDELIQRADQALYAAKAAGRDRVRIEESNGQIR
jgi:diguanylate cyclase (GGDEF)-like protein|tara:strand:- start:63442 stop:66360 length:2919 start_codon:yes stop_codon:yes gene_type:complete